MKGEKRKKKEKPTRKEVELNNRLQKREKIHREMIVNFEKGDYWVTLTYEKGTRKTLDDVYKDVKKMIDKMRVKYKKVDEQFKWMYAIEIGSKGGIHCHMLMNQIQQTIQWQQELWKQGMVDVKFLKEEEERKALADYLAKVPPEKDEKNNKPRSERLQELTEENYKYGSSRNLIRPEPEVKPYRRRTMRKILEEGPEPTPGYYIDKSTIRKGFNKFTGYSYLYYTEIELRRRE